MAAERPKRLTRIAIKCDWSCDGPAGWVIRGRCPACGTGLFAGGAESAFICDKMRQTILDTFTPDFSCKCRWCHVERIPGRALTWVAIA
jgi:hypothetical protein